jgi:hypothetical protein
VPPRRHPSPGGPAEYTHPDGVCPVGSSLLLRGLRRIDPYAFRPRSTARFSRFDYGLFLEIDFDFDFDFYYVLFAELALEFDFDF